MNLTCGEAIPNLQPVVSADGAGRRRGVGLHVEAVELHYNLRHLWGEYHEGAVQVVRVLLGETRCLDDAAGSREVPGAFWTCGVGIQTRSIRSQTLLLMFGTKTETKTVLRFLDVQAS